MAAKNENSKKKVEKKTTKKTAEPAKAETPQKAEKKKKTSNLFEKGHDKVGGRKAGTPNKYGNIRDRLKELIMPYLEQDPEKMVEGVPTLAKDLIKISDPKDRAEVVSKYLPFVVPKYSSTTITADADRPVDEEQALMELDAQYTKKELTLTLKQVTIVNNDNITAPPAAPITDFDPDEEDNWDVSELE